MKSKRSVAKQAKSPKLSRTYAPDHMAPADWQRALRQQFGREQAWSFLFQNMQNNCAVRRLTRGVPDDERAFRVVTRHDGLFAFQMGTRVSICGMAFSMLSARLP